MRYKLYYYFYETVKRFIKDKNFFIEFYVLGSSHLLKFDTTLKLFVHDKFFASYQKAENVYEIIKEYAIKEISNEQKEVFSCIQEKRYPSYIQLNEKENEIFIELIEKFKDKLWKEPIFPNDIKTEYFFERIQYAFSDSFVWPPYIAPLIDILKLYPKSFERGKISNYMWGRDIINDIYYMDALEELQIQGYIDFYIKEDQIEITLTKKFYESLKRAFYFDFDPNNELNEVFKKNNSFTEKTMIHFDDLT